MSGSSRIEHEMGEQVALATLRSACHRPPKTHDAQEGVEDRLQYSAKVVTHTAKGYQDSLAPFAGDVYKESRYPWNPKPPNFAFSPSSAHPASSLSASQNGLRMPSPCHDPQPRYMNKQAYDWHTSSRLHNLKTQASAK
jgi:hypothetical protein